MVFVNGEKLIAEEILVSIGRTPNIKSLNLEKAKVKHNNQGIEVNNKLQTSNKKIYGRNNLKVTATTLVSGQEA